MSPPMPVPESPVYSHFSDRRPARMTLRRPSRSLDRDERAPSRRTSGIGNANPAGKHLDPDDSSDDEIPVPMKLSALTKALLNDDVAELEVSSAASIPGKVPLSLPVAAKPLNPDPGLPPLRKTDSTRTTRSTVSRSSSRPGSRHSSRPSSPQHSRENSPVRKRIVRLSTTPVGVPRTHRRSTSASRSTARPTSAASARPAKPGEDGLDHINTPAQAVRHVRIALGSSADRYKVPPLSYTSSRKHDPPASTNGYDSLEDLAVSIKTQRATRHGSISQAVVKTTTKPRVEEPLALSQSIDAKPVSKGTFLSGPARRGRRRQSEEEHSQLEENPDRLSYNSDYCDNNKAPREDNLGPASSFLGTIQQDAILGSDSPKLVSRARSSSRHRRLPDSEPGIEDGNAAFDDLPPLTKPVQPQVEQENDRPLVYRPKPISARGKTDAPLLSKSATSAAGGSADDERPVSPDRKPLSVKSRNTPKRAPPPVPPKVSAVDMGMSAPSGSASAGATAHPRKRNMLRLNNKYYTRIKCLGKGGSAKVYRVTTDSGEMLAMKRVSMEHAVPAEIRGYKGEIDLLKKLADVDRVITLLDYEMNEEKQMLSLLMEAGDLDFNSILREEKDANDEPRFDPVFVRHYWKEMLECVRAIHKHDIVHSDLKPANFVSVHGRLKLIDFGIANAIRTDETVNVHRDTKVGTPNYMSPESLIDTNQASSGGGGGVKVPGASKIVKLGKPSDVWSLGCILYQMVYGLPPFGHIPNQIARCHAITNWNHAIDFPDVGLGGMHVPPSLLRTMKRCLSREIHLRPTVEELLSISDPFLYPAEMPSDGAATLPMTEELLGRIIQSVVMRCKEGLPSSAEAMTVWPQAYWASAKKHIANKENERKQE